MKNTKTVILALIVGSTLTLNALAEYSTKNLNAKCRINYSQGEVGSRFFKFTKQVVKFSNNRRHHSDRCKKATNKLIKKANKWLKDSFEYPDGTLQRTITNIQPIECAVEHVEGFACIGKGYGSYRECGDKYDNKFKNKLIKKL
jgi:hypothetical protein